MKRRSTSGETENDLVARARGGSTEPVGGDQIVGGSRTGQAVAVLCFAVVFAAIAWGIYLIAAGA